MQILFMTCNTALYTGCGTMFLADIGQSHVGTVVSKQDM